MWLARRRARWVFSAVVAAAFLAGFAIGGCMDFAREGTAKPQAAATRAPALAGSSSEDQGGFEAVGRQFVKVAKQVTPSVVYISSEKVVTRQTPGFFFGPFDDFFRGSPFEQFFNQPREREYHQYGLGSGVVVRSDGYILTNNHVVADAREIKVTLSDKREFEAKVVGTDPKTDVAVIRIGQNGLAAATLGDSDKLEVGEWVLAVGNPFGLTHTVSAGIVSAVGRSNLQLADYEDFIQTDAAINPGNSGGPLVNVRGEVVGINTAIASRTGTYSGVGFAIPIKMAKAVMDELIDRGRVTRGYLGILPQQVTQDLAKAMGLPEPRGILIAEVVQGTPADKAGLRQGDVILTLQGKRCDDVNRFRSDVAAVRPGGEVELTILRDKKEKTVRVKLEEYPSEEAAPAREMDAGARLGLQVQELTPALAERLGYKGQQGVLVSSVEQGSISQRAGISEGDLIQKANRRDVASVRDYQQAMSQVKPGDTVLLVVRTRFGARFLTLTVPK